MSELGFHDFAGSAIVHMLGGTLSFVGAAILGPRIGKYTKDGKVNVIPGHNILIGALGVLILWVGWFGFNPASTGGLSDGGVQVAAKVFITTNLAACAAAITTMFFTWIRYGKPDVSMTLNGVLGGLVAITAPCDLVTPFASIIIGVVGAILMCLAIPFIDTKLKVDDPVGAISVHGICGLWGTIGSRFVCFRYKCRCRITWSVLWRRSKGFGCSSFGCCFTNCMGSNHWFNSIRCIEEGWITSC